MGDQDQDIPVNTKEGLRLVNKAGLAKLQKSGYGREATMEERGIINSAEAQGAVVKQAGEGWAGPLVGAASALTSAVPGMGFASKLAIRGISGEEEAARVMSDLELGQQANPYWHAGGSIGGALAGTALGAGAGKLASLLPEGSMLARGAQGAATFGKGLEGISMAPFLGLKVGGAAIPGMNALPGMSRLATLGAEGSLAARLGANSLRMGTEMGLYGAADEAMTQLGEKVTTKDAHMDAMKIFGAGLTGAGMGALFGAGVTGASALFNRARTAATEAPGLAAKAGESMSYKKADEILTRTPGGAAAIDKEIQAAAGDQLAQKWHNPPELVDATAIRATEKGTAVRSFAQEQKLKSSVLDTVADMHQRVGGVELSGGGENAVRNFMSAELGKVAKEAGIASHVNAADYGKLLAEGSEGRTLLGYAKNAQALEDDLSRVLKFDPDVSKAAIKGAEEQLNVLKTLPNAPEVAAAIQKEEAGILQMKVDVAETKELARKLGEIAGLEVRGAPVEKARDVVKKLSEATVDTGDLWQHRVLVQQGITDFASKNAANVVRDAFESSIQNSIERGLGPDGLSKYRLVKDEYAVAKAANQLAEARMEQFARTGGPSTAGASGTIGKLGAAGVGAAAYGMGAHGFGAFMTGSVAKGGLDRAAAYIRDNAPIWKASLGGALNSSFDKGILSLVGRSEMETRQILENVVFKGDRAKSYDHPEIAAQKNPVYILGPTDKKQQTNMASIIRTLQDPSRAVIDYTESLGDLAKTRPQTAAAMVATYSRALSFLAEKAPKGKNPAFSLAPWAEADTFNKMEMQMFSRYMETSLHPNSVLYRIASDSIKKENVEALKVVHPEYFQYLKQEMGNLMLEHSNALKLRKIGLNRRMQLARFFGIGGKGLTDPNLFMAIQASFGTASADGQPQPPPQEGPSVNSSSVGTEMDRRDGSESSL